MDEIIPNLYMGSYPTLKKLINMNTMDKKITHVINVAQELKYSIKILTYFNENNITWSKFPMKDIDEYDIYTEMEEILNLITKIYETPNSKIYIHCHMGISRSASVVIAFVSKHLEISISDAHKLVKEKRPLINPRQSFLNKLKNPFN
jgi:protein-tyrosine phosphatase